MSNDLIDLVHVANFLSNMVCSEHNKSMKAEAKGESIYFSDPCCGEFEKRVHDEYARQVNIKIMNRFKNLGKK